LETFWNLVGQRVGGIPGFTLVLKGAGNKDWFLKSPGGAFNQRTMDQLADQRNREIFNSAGAWALES